MKTMTNKFPSKCSICDAPLPKGEHIVVNSGAPAHTACHLYAEFKGRLNGGVARAKHASVK